MDLNFDNVVLVNEQNHVVGTMPKKAVHQMETPLHRAFSLFLFRADGKLLIQQRCRTKKTWPLIWSNSCCGHIALGEKGAHAVARRLNDELGMTLSHLRRVQYYRYQFVKNGVMENEICPIWAAISTDEPKQDPNEVEATRWVKLNDYIEAVKADPENFSPWSAEEAELLTKNDFFRQWLKIQQLHELVQLS